MPNFSCFASPFPTFNFQGLGLTSEEWLWRSCLWTIWRRPALCPVEAMKEHMESDKGKRYESYFLIAPSAIFASAGALRWYLCWKILTNCGYLNCQLDWISCINTFISHELSYNETYEINICHFFVVFFRIPLFTTYTSDGDFLI